MGWYKMPVSHEPAYRKILAGGILEEKVALRPLINKEMMLMEI